MGFETSDDGGIYRLTDDIAIITTADFITPMVNDPFVYGQISAANAMSDIYAMGGRPVTCLNLVAFPSKKLQPEVLHQIVAGALDKITEAGAVLAGGHSIDDDEPKFGLAVTGVVHPKKYWTNSGAAVGDVLILTKAIGSGVLFNANLKKWVSAPALNECLATLVTLNKTAAETLQDFEVHAVTDITGFGLAGHGFEMAKASDVRLEIYMDDIPILSEALAMYKKGMDTGMTALNRQMVAKHMRFEKDLPAWHQNIVFDPQTSGGLLVAVPENSGENVLRALRDAGVVQAKIIGNITTRRDSTYLAFC